MRPIRWLFPGSVWLVTNRCEMEQFFLLPSEKINNLIGAWLGRAIEKYGDGIELYGFIFMSNHFHLFLRDTKGQLAKVMGYFQTNLAKEVNRQLGRKNGHVFARRYDAELVDGEPEFEKRYAYVAANAVKPGLVEHALDWPGLSSLQAALDCKTMRFEMLDRTAYHNATRRNKKVDIAKYMRSYEISLTTPPMWAHLSKEEVRHKIEELIKGFEAKYRKARQSENKPVLGAQAVLRQKPTDRPKNASFEPRVYVLCQDRLRREELKESWSQITASYRECYDGYRKASKRKTKFHNEWPEWTCPPSRRTPTGYPKAA